MGFVGAPGKSWNLKLLFDYKEKWNKINDKNYKTFANSYNLEEKEMSLARKDHYFQQIFEIKENN